MKTYKEIRKSISVFGLNGKSIIILFGIVFISIIVLVIFYSLLMTCVMIGLCFGSYIALSYRDFQADFVQKPNNLPSDIMNQPRYETM